jgi:antitoxin MazE
MPSSVISFIACASFAPWIRCLTTDGSWSGQDRQYLCSRGSAITCIWLVTLAALPTNIVPHQLRQTCTDLRDILHSCISPEESMQVAKWGNSLAVRIPTAVVEALDLKEGDEVEISVAGKRDFKVARDRGKEWAIEELRKMKWHLPPGFKFNRREIYER